MAATSASTGWRPGPPGLPRLLVGLDPSGAVMTLADHERVHGPLPQHSPHELIEAIERSGLRGRGGADFPTARKLRAVADRGHQPTLVINGSETEPASGKDRLLLSRLPHLVLDGAVLAAGAIDTDEVIVKVGEGADSMLRALEAAISARGEDHITYHLAAGPEGYVTGEESAVVSFLNGHRAVPTLVPPRPYERGYRGRPTLIQNPETLAQIALVSRYGDHWYRELGTAADPGSALVTISGAVRAPGVYELAFGTPMTDLLDAAGGPTEPLQALLVGGYFGTWVDTARAMRLRLAREDLRSVGCSLGSGVLIALGESAVRPARVRAADRLPRLPVRGPVRAVLCTASGRSPTRSARSPTASPTRGSASAFCAGRTRSVAAAPATTPTAPSASSRARSTSSAATSTGTASRAAPLLPPGCRWPPRAVPPRAAAATAVPGSARPRPERESEDSDDRPPPRQPDHV